jgi:dihydroorotase
MRFDTILKQGHCVLPWGTLQTDVGILNGRIAALGTLDPGHAATVIDCKHLHVLPGVIDTQVHFRDPGMTHKEDLGTGTLAAIAGGVTTVFEMPNTHPLTTTPQALQDKLDKAATHAWCHYAFYLGGTADNAMPLAQWENLPGVCGIKIFMGASTGNLLVTEDEHIEAILRHGRRLVAIHAEDEAIMTHNKKTILGNSDDVTLHPAWRSEESCLNATRRLLALAEKTGRKVHLLHITTAQELDLLAQHRHIATVEVLANHLTLAAPECYQQLGTLAQQNPPIREAHHQQALWAAINSGLVDILATDHAPHTLEEKAKPYPNSPSGMPGVQTLVPIMLNHVAQGRLSLARFVDLTAHGPARVHQLVGKGRIAQGYDADFTLVDLNARHTITHAQQHSRSGWTPFDGMSVTGWPVMTMLMGQVAMEDDAIVAPHPQGQCVRFRG